jgi:hypothetical protein
VSDLSWLTKHVRKDGGSVRYEWTQSAFSFENRTGATDGMSLLVVNEPSACPPVPEGSATLVRDILNIAGEPTLKTTKGDIRAWCGRDPEKACPRCKDTDTSPCKWCGGSGKGKAVSCDDCGHDHTCACSHCFGTKTGPCVCLLVKDEGDAYGYDRHAAAQGWLAGILVNRDRLARLMAVELGEPGEEVAVYALTGTSGARLTLVGKNWQAVVMQIDPSAAVSSAVRFGEKVAK